MAVSAFRMMEGGSVGGGICCDTHGRSARHRTANRHRAGPCDNRAVWCALIADRRHQAARSIQPVRHSRRGHVGTAAAGACMARSTASSQSSDLLAASSNTRSSARYARAVTLSAAIAPCPLSRLVTSWPYTMPGRMVRRWPPTTIVGRSRWKFSSMTGTGASFDGGKPSTTCFRSKREKPE